MKNKPITCVSLMLSCGCNLQCEYCLIAKSVNENSSNVQKATIEALQNGTFLNNTIKVLNKRDTSPKDITRMEFWGQEPTLTLNYLTEHLEDWLTEFSNVSHFMFSTNGVGFTYKIVDFLKKLDQCTTTPTEIDIQFSYDGEWSNENNRKFNSSTVTNNIIYFLKELNKIHFNFVKVHVQFHAVISLKLIEELTTIDKINDYYANLFEWSNQFISINHNQNVTLTKFVDLALENPVDASVQDGINLAKFFDMLRKSEYNIKHNQIASGQITHFIESPYKKTIQDLITYEIPDLLCLLSEYNIDYENFKKKILPIFSRMQFCGANFSELKIMYDGTLLNCQNQIFDVDSNYINKTKNIHNLIKKDLSDKKRLVNPLKDTQEDIDKVFNLHQLAKEDAFLIVFNNVLNLMYVLSHCGQIDPDYRYNQNKILYHAFIISVFNVCAYNRAIKTGSIFLTYSGQIRFFCNGFLDLIFDITTGEFKI